MHLDCDVRSKHKQGFQILDVLINSFRLVTVGPSHDDVLGVAFLQTIPLLVPERVEVERVKRLEILSTSDD
jgi:hypothetical protein